jgi:diguanylate cyclase (GGDEF)-like protein/PAS domain S-box-containing protein
VARKRYKLSTLINLTLLAVYLLGSAALVAMVNINAKREALVNAEHYSRLILDRNIVTHSFFNSVLKTSLFELLNEHFFEPTWMSSTFAIKSVANDYEFFGEDGLYYKEASINARNPANEADPIERAFIERTNQDEQLTVESEIRQFNGQPFFVITRRGQLLKTECLRCHGNPADAPPGIIAHYGDKRGFGRLGGKVVSAISIQIPLAMAYQNANQFSIQLSAMLMVVLMLIFATHYMISHQLLFRPLARLHEKSRQIAADQGHLGVELPVPVGRELAELVEGFNLMSTNLRDYRDVLEETILQRTDELEHANHALRDDIEQRKQIERNLEQLRQRNELILNTAREGIMGLDRERRIIFLNRAAEALLGIRGETLDKIRLLDLLSAADEHVTLPGAMDLVAEVLDKGTTVNQYEATLVHRTGRSFPIEFSCAPIVENGIVGAVLSFNDITDRKLSEREIQKLAFFDQLTDLPNRTLFYDRLAQRVAQMEREQTQLALMFLDLDDFKMVNDTLGHAAGDEFLQVIAQRLRAGSRLTDTVARLGGDEFVWFGEISAEKDVTLIAQKFLESIAQPVRLGPHTIGSTVSIGIALFPESASDVAGLLKAADAAMYTIKRTSKNAFQLFRRSPST